MSKLDKRFADKRRKAAILAKIGTPLMSAFEVAKRRRNVDAGYKETKGLKNGHCNRAACQAPLDGQPQSYMQDHETFTKEGKLYYCLPCTRQFNDSDDRFQPDMPRRCTLESTEGSQT